MEGKCTIFQIHWQHNQSKFRRANLSKFDLGTLRSEDTSGDELDDKEVQNIIIVTQTPNVLRKHPGGDRTAQSYHRSKLSIDAAETINVGLYFYEQVRTLLW